MDAGRDLLMVSLPEGAVVVGTGGVLPQGSDDETAGESSNFGIVQLDKGGVFGMGRDDKFTRSEEEGGQFLPITTDLHVFHNMAFVEEIAGCIIGCGGHSGAKDFFIG